MHIANRFLERHKERRVERESQRAAARIIKAAEFGAEPEDREPPYRIEIGRKLGSAASRAMYALEVGERTIERLKILEEEGTLRQLGLVGLGDLHIDRSAMLENCSKDSDALIVQLRTRIETDPPLHRPAETQAPAGNETSQS